MKQLGVKGEGLAVEFLKRKGYRVISRNFKTPLGEIDIVARDGETLVFVEVKTRTDTAFGQPFEAVNYRKREKIKKVALYYLKNNCRKELSSRFDVLSIEINADKSKIEHIIDAFE